MSEIPKEGTGRSEETWRGWSLQKRQLIKCNRREDSTGVDVNRSTDMADIHWDNYHWSSISSGKNEGKSCTEDAREKCRLEAEGKRTRDKRESARMSRKQKDETRDQKEYFHKSREQGLYLFNRLLN